MGATAHSRVNDEETPQRLPRGARMILKDYSDKEAVQSREQGLVSTLTIITINILPVITVRARGSTGSMVSWRVSE